MYSIGIDLGGTNIAAGIVDGNYKIIKKMSIPTGASRHADEITGDMASLCKKLCAEAGIAFDDIESIGIATPGSADSENGQILYANNLPFTNYKMADVLVNKLGTYKKVYIENDANAAAKAESVAGAAKGTRYSVMITLGTGVGGGIIIDGQIYKGFNCAGAELGHIVIERGGRPCSCGRLGCWETYSSATGLVKTTKEVLEQSRKQGRKTVMEDMIGGNLARVSGRTAFAALRKEGDEVAREVVEKYIDGLVCGLVNIINIFQPEVLSIGGGISGEGEYLLNMLPEKVFAETYSRGDTPQCKLKIAELGNDAGIIGAAALGK
ncbi:MAG: ROK family protein [Clostridia bacterium]|nr:ROK family protein [Clostridia bacterium]